MNKNKLKNEKGSITLYVLVSMFFFIVVVFGIYFNTNSKMQKQNKEIEKIQKEYEKENINDVYEKVYGNYVNTETPTIQGYVGAVLKGEVIGEKTSSKKTVYFASNEVKLKLLSKNENNTFAYSTTQNGDKIKMEGNALDITATIEGTTYYFYVVDSSGNYSKYYTAITAKLVTMQNKTIYVGEGQTVDIGKIEGENLGSISYSKTEDNTIATVVGDKVTGVKAGNTTSTITEKNAGQTCTLTIKVVKIGLAKTEETTLLGVNKTVSITGTNYGTLSIQVEDSTIATANISGNNLTVIPKKEGNTTITVTENNARVTETYKIKVANVTLSPESGIYTMPTEGQATIKTQVKAVNAEKIEYAWSNDIEDWKEIENNEIVTKTDATAGTYYLLVRINGEAIYKSGEFVVGDNTLTTNKITITPNKTELTTENIITTISYGSTLTQNKKAGYGTTLAEAKNAASQDTATSITVTDNGYVYAEATDAAGNKITASLQITNIRYLVTCEDWFVTSSYERKVKLGSSTKLYVKGDTAKGSDWGSTKTQGTYYSNYYYENCSSSVINTRNITVYRYFSAFVNINILNSYGQETFDLASFDLRIDNVGTWSGLYNEPDVGTFYGSVVAIQTNQDLNYFFGWNGCYYSAANNAWWTACVGPSTIELAKATVRADTEMAYPSNWSPLTQYQTTGVLYQSSQSLDLMSTGEDGVSYNTFHMVVAYYSVNNLQNTFNIDLYPDDLPEIHPVTQGNSVRWIQWGVRTDTSFSFSSCRWRIFDDIYDQPNDTINFRYRSSRVGDYTGKTWQNLYN